MSQSNPIVGQYVLVLPVALHFRSSCTSLRIGYFSNYGIGL